MIEPYDRKYIQTVQGIAEEEAIDIKEGVYYGLSGPTFETPAEYRMIYRLGGDAVGMSTVPEVIVARHGGMRVFGLSVITDIGYPPENVEHVDHEYVLKAAQEVWVSGRNPLSWFDPCSWVKRIAIDYCFS